MNRYTAHRAPILLDRPHTAPQGLESRDWFLCRVAPDMDVYLPKEDDPRGALSPAEAWLWVAIFILSTVLSAHVLCVVADWLKWWLS